MVCSYLDRASFASRRRRLSYPHYQERLRLHILPIKYGIRSKLYYKKREHAAVIGFYNEEILTSMDALCLASTTKSRKSSLAVTIASLEIRCLGCFCNNSFFVSAGSIVVVASVMVIMQNVLEPEK